MIRLMIAMVASLLLTGCGSKQAQAAEQVADEPLCAPVLANADSLYSFVKQQVDCGPRVPGSKAHEACRNLIVKALKEYGVEAEFQPAAVTTFRGEKLTAYNIFGRINPEAKNRILLLAHYDTRPWADEDPDEAKQLQPLDGANDGGSGVAVMLEIARCMQSLPTDSVGVDLLFVDVEDSGESGGADESTWCLGTQKWADSTPYAPGETPEFGILFDMVGGKDAKFNREYFSQQYAKGAVDKIWAVANASGFAERFPNSIGGSIIDDHLYINQAGIPCIDIIESANPQTGSFNPTWHTTADSLEAIDSETLRIVAQVVLNYLYK
jgi:hypothetical protein